MDIEQAKLDPCSVFSHPDEVLEEASLTEEQKINILKRWEYDARELAIADEENMAGGPTNQLDEVLDALNRLVGDKDK